MSLVLISLTGLILIPWMGHNEVSRKKNELMVLVRTVTSFLHPSEIASLTGTPRDLNSPVYLRIKRQLYELSAAAPSVRFLYIMRMCGGNLIFLADSEPPESPDYSPPGQIYHDGNDEMAAVFTMGRETVYGPHKDSWGTWISAHAPLRDPGTGGVIALVGADTDVSDIAAAVIGRIWYSAAMILFLLVSLIILYRVVKKSELSRNRIEVLDALRIDSEKNYRRIIENLEDSYYRIDLQGKIIQVNPSFVRLFRYASTEDLIGGDVRSLWLNPVERDTFIAELDSTGKVRDYEIQGLRKDGTDFYAAISAHLISNDKGEVFGYEGLLHDITEQKERETRYRNYNSMFSSMVDILSGGDMLSQIKLLTELSAHVFDVAYAGVWRLDSRKSRMCNVDLYNHNEGSHHDGYDLDVRELNDYIHFQRQSTVISVQDVYTDERTKKIPSFIFSEFQTSSVMDIPVFLEGALWGMLSFWHSGEKRKWHPEEEQVAITLSAQISIIIEADERKKAIAALRDSEMRFRAIAEQVTDIIFVTDIESTIEFISPSVTDVLGWSKEDVLQHTLADFLPEHEFEKCARAFEDTMSSKNALKNVQLQVLHRNGGIIFVELNISLLWRNDRVAGTIGVIRDITERKLTEEKNKSTLERLRELEFIINHSPVTVWVWRPGKESIIEFVSDGIGAYGYRTDEIMGNGLMYLDIIHPEDVNRVNEEIDKCTRDGRSDFNQEYRIKTRSGDTRWVDSRVIVKRNQDGAVERYQGIIIDITDRKEAENLLHRRDELQRMLMDLGAEFIHVSMDHIDTAITDALESIGTYTEVDRAFVFSYDFKASKVHCTHEWFASGLKSYMHRLQDISLGPFNGLTASHRSGRTVVVSDMDNCRPDDPLYGYIRSHGIKTILTIPLMDEEECLGFIAFCMVFRNKEWSKDEINLLKVLGELYAKLEIQRRYETQLIEARKAAESANIAKGQFLAGMSHEIRTPMNGVIGMAELMLSTPLTQEQKRYAQIISSSGEHLLTLIDAILDYSKFEAGKFDIVIDNFNLREVVEDIIDFMALRAQKKGLEFVCVVQKDVTTRLRGDPYRLKQVMINLAGNAIKCTDHGEVVIRIAAISDTESRTDLRFEVTDTGKGIPEDKIPLLFQPFVQLDSLPGTGLGLVISRTIVELMGGTIGVFSEPGKGSTFWFEVPFEKAAQENTGGDVDTGAFAGQNVLVIDRSMPSCQHLCETMAAWNVLCASAHDTVEALRKIAEARDRGNPFTVMILDSGDADGSPDDFGEFIRLAKKENGGSNIIPVLMTKISDQIDTASIVRIGFSAGISKPVKHSALYNCLADITGAAAASSEQLWSPESDVIEGDDIILKPYTVLIVEDNEINQEITAMMLKKLGYRSELASSGRDAIDMLTRKNYDCILMDCQMPGMDGYETTCAIRNNSSHVGNHAIPIIAMTASVMREDRDRCLAAGMDDFLPKPMQIKKLEDILTKWIDTEKYVTGSTAGQDPAAAHSAVHNSGEDVYDLKVLEDKLRLGSKLIITIIELFNENIPKQIDDLRYAVENNDPKTARRLAHTMKGSSAQMGARKMFTLAAEMEIMAEQGNLTSIGPRIDELKSAFETYSLAVAEWQKDIDLKTE